MDKPLGDKLVGSVEGGYTTYWEGYRSGRSFPNSWKNGVDMHSGYPVPEGG